MQSVHELVDYNGNFNPSLALIADYPCASDKKTMRGYNRGRVVGGLGAAFALAVLTGGISVNIQFISWFLANSKWARSNPDMGSSDNVRVPRQQEVKPNISSFRRGFVTSMCRSVGGPVTHVTLAVAGAADLCVGLVKRQKPDGALFNSVRDGAYRLNLINPTRSEVEHIAKKSLLPNF